MSISSNNPLNCRIAASAGHHCDDEDGDDADGDDYPLILRQKSSMHSKPKPQGEHLDY